MSLSTHPVMKGERERENPAFDARGHRNWSVFNRTSRSPLLLFSPRALSPIYGMDGKVGKAFQKKRRKGESMGTTHTRRKVKYWMGKVLLLLPCQGKKRIAFIFLFFFSRYIRKFSEEYRCFFLVWEWYGWHSGRRRRMKYWYFCRVSLSLLSHTRNA